MIDETRFYLGEIEHFIQRSPDVVAIQSYLVEHALVKIYAAFESEVCNALAERCASSNDLARDRYVANMVKRTVRSVKINELKGILGGFGKDYKTVYSSNIQEKPNAEIAYNNILQNRHAVAHGGTRSATWNDVYTWWDDALPIVTEFRSVLAA